MPAGSAAARWQAAVTEGKQRELAAYKARGLRVISKLDMVVLPATLLMLYKAEITDPRTGKLSFARNKTRALLSAMFDEVCPEGLHTQEVEQQLNRAAPAYYTKLV